MKKMLSFFAFVCLFAATTFAQSGAVMSLEKTEMDYGTIDQGADPVRYFNFKNTGTEPLVIKNAQGSCGCTVPEWPKEPIMPGQSSKIKVSYDTQRVGPFTKSVTLTTNEASDKRVLTIKGEVKAKAKEAEGVPATKGSVLAPKG